MTLMMDIALAEDDDLDITGGDIFPVESTAQHQRQLLLNNKGDFKENPTVCVGITSYLDDESSNNLIRATIIELNRDGQQVQQIGIANTGVLNINAYYP